MSKEGAIGLTLVLLLLGGIILLARRPMPVGHALIPQYQRNIKITPIQPEPRRYKNKETRRIEYNDDGLPTLIEITRDYAVT